MNETFGEVVNAFNGNAAIVIFPLAMVVLAVWHEVRTRRRRRRGG